jgi:hypothetical protein
MFARLIELVKNKSSLADIKNKLLKEKINQITEDAAITEEVISAGNHSMGLFLYDEI